MHAMYAGPTRVIKLPPSDLHVQKHCNTQREGQCILSGLEGEEERPALRDKEAEQAAVYDGMEGLGTKAAKLRFGQDLRLLEVQTANHLIGSLLCTSFKPHMWIRICSKLQQRHCDHDLGNCQGDWLTGLLDVAI